MDFLELSQMLRTNFRVAELKKPHRYARVYIDIPRLSDMLHHKMTNNLPEDCTIYSVGYAEDHMGLCLVMHSETWEEVPEGTMIPEFNITWTVLSPEPGMTYIDKLLG